MMFIAVSLEPYSLGMDHRARPQTPPSYPSPWPRRADHINASRLCTRPCPAFPGRPRGSDKAAESQAFGCAGRVLAEEGDRKTAQQKEQHGTENGTAARRERRRHNE